MKTSTQMPDGKRVDVSVDFGGLALDPDLERVRWSNGFAVETEQPSSEGVYEIDLTTTLFWVEKGSVPLRVRKPLKLRYRDTDAGEVIQVMGWDIEVQSDAADSLNRLIPRKFLDLFSKSQRRALTPQEDKLFAEICETVDYRSFATRRASLRYREAKLVRKHPILSVEFSNGSKETLNRDLLNILDVLEVGDWFSAQWRIGVAGEPVHIERLEIIPDPQSLPDSFWDTE
jgi:hypothetical protein